MKVVEMAKEVFFCIGDWFDCIGDWFDYNLYRIYIFLMVIALMLAVIVLTMPKEEAPVFCRAILQENEMEIDLDLKYWEYYSDSKLKLVAEDGTIYIVPKDRIILVCDK